MPAPSAFGFWQRTTEDVGAKMLPAAVKGDPMKKNTPKKMTLSRETLHQLERVRGGEPASIIIIGPQPLTTDSVRVCCA
jgi:hypothetical protein